jgi:putative transposase
VAPSTYYEARSRQPSARALRDAVLIPILVALWQANFSVYGIHKLWIAAKKAGHDVGRDQVARLMRTAGIRGVQRRRGVTTTKRRRGADVAPDLVHRVFHAERPNALWVSDLTYVRTTEGMAYVCFVVDAFSRMIVGWQVASEMTVQTVLRALDMARLRRGAFHAGLVAHSDAGSQYTSVRYGERLQRSARFPPSVRSGTAMTTHSPRA